MKAAGRRAREGPRRLVAARGPGPRLVRLLDGSRRNRGPLAEACPRPGRPAQAIGVGQLEAAAGAGAGAEEPESPDLLSEDFDDESADDESAGFEDDDEDAEEEVEAPEVDERLSVL
ncbi:hypothetical protein [Nonomuraea deserti]|uniref:hypothetical protein n=1 Tax=Nonomuraea deserti TaxID=1848322 RepID=UPI0026BFBFB0